MPELQSVSKYVQPRYYQELGCEGLSAKDIANSLGVDTTHVREKLSVRGFCERIEKQDMNTAIAMKKNINGLEYTEYYLSVDAAKFFVAKYDNKVGDGYLAFLIKLENHHQKAKELAKQYPLMAQMLQLQEMYMAQIETNERVAALEERIDCVDDKFADMALTQTQKDILKEKIDEKALRLGGYRNCGVVQSLLKKKYGINATNGRWYDIRQRFFSDACDFVDSI